MRIVLLDDSFLHYTAQLANALADAGNDVLFIASHDTADFAGDNSVEARREFMDIVGPKVRLEWMHISAITSLRTLPANLRSAARIAKLIRNYRPDILHVQETVNYRELGAIKLAGRGLPMVLTVHNAEMHPGKKASKTEFLRSRLRRSADVIIVHGREIGDRLLEDPGMNADKIHRVPIGAYAYYRKWLSGRPQVPNTILFFGSVFRYKGLHYLIQAAPKVLEDIPNAKFVIAGSGPDWPRCKTLIQNHESFTLYEHVISNPEVTHLFEEASVVVLPYVEASQSAVLCLSFALGKPTIVTDVGSMPEMVDDGETGLVVPPGDAEALAGAIVRLLKDSNLRESMAARAYQKASSGDLTWASVASKTADIYRQLIKAEKANKE